MSIHNYKKNGKSDKEREKKERMSWPIFKQERIWRWKPESL